MQSDIAPQHFAHFPQHVANKMSYYWLNMQDGYFWTDTDALCCLWRVQCHTQSWCDWVNCHSGLIHQETTHCPAEYTSIRDSRGRSPPPSPTHIPSSIPLHPLLPSMFFHLPFLFNTNYVSTDAVQIVFLRICQIIDFGTKTKCLSVELRKSGLSCGLDFSTINLNLNSQCQTAATLEVRCSKGRVINNPE